MAQPFQMLPALPEDLSSVPSIHAMCLTITCNSSSEKTQRPSPASSGTITHTDTHITENEINLVKKILGPMGRLGG